MGREIEQHIPLRDRSKQAVIAGTEKNLSTLTDKAVTFSTTEISEKPSDASVSEAVDTIHDLERIREESAAIKAQAAFRGYLVIMPSLAIFFGFHIHSHFLLFINFLK